MRKGKLNKYLTPNPNGEEWAGNITKKKDMDKKKQNKKEWRKKPEQQKPHLICGGCSGYGIHSELVVVVIYIQLENYQKRNVPTWREKNA